MQRIEMRERETENGGRIVKPRFEQAAKAAYPQGYFACAVFDPRYDETDRQMIRYLAEKAGYSEVVGHEG